MGLMQYFRFLMEDDGYGRGISLFLWLLFFNLWRSTTAQSDKISSGPAPSNLALNSPVTMVITILVIAFFLLCALSLYIRFGNASVMDGGLVGVGLIDGLIRRQPPGLCSQVLESFPTMVYSEVKELRIGKTAPECAVCLSEFEDSDTLRLLPACQHVFHQECVDPWFASHITCPVCRTNLAEAATADTVEGSDPQANAAAVDGNLCDGGDEREAPSLQVAIDVDPFPPVWADRNTLRLPEHVLKDIISKRKIAASASFHVLTKGESSARGRSARFGWSDRWLEIVTGTLSSRFPAMSSERKGEEQVSPAAGRISREKASLDCLTGSGVKGSIDLDESMKGAAPQRV